MAADSDVHGIDVAARFKAGIRFGFWLSFINFVRATLAQVAFVTKKWQLLLISYFIFALSLSAMIVLFVLMNIWRFSHSGQVCSGDFIKNRDEDDMTEDELNNYTITEGKFIFVILVLVYLKVGIEVTILLIAMCVITYRQGGENVKTETKELFAAAVDDQV